MDRQQLNDELHNAVEELVNAVTELGHTPAWVSDVWRGNYTEPQPVNDWGVDVHDHTPDTATVEAAADHLEEKLSHA